MADLFHRIAEALTGENHEEHLKNDDASSTVKIKGTVVLIKSNVLGFNDFKDSLLDGLHELVGNRVSFDLVSATVGDPSQFFSTSSPSCLFPLSVSLSHSDSNIWVALAV